MRSLGESRIVQAEDQWGAFDALRDLPLSAFGLVVSAEPDESANPILARTSMLLCRWGREADFKAAVASAVEQGLDDTTEADRALAAESLSAVFSACRTWRYTLTRRVADLACAPGCRADEGSGLHSVDCRTVETTALFVCLNPSTADETQNDPTVRRCISFAKRWGYTQLVVCNIFALCSTDPDALYGHDDPVGPENDRYLVEHAQWADFIVCAWGNHGDLRDRGKSVASELAAWDEIHALGFTGRGQPKHPLYLPSLTRPVKW